MRKSLWRPILMSIVALLILIEIVALFPSHLEEEAQIASIPIDPDTLVQKEKTLATGIPKNQIPDYSVDGFNYVSTQGGEKQWKLLADRALMYNKDRLVHSRKIKAFLYDPDGKITIVTGLEAKYFMNQRDLEIFGNVHTIFPDGFEMQSEYLRYLPNRHHVEIPATYAVAGHGDEMSFTSYGMSFEMAKSEITLPVRAKLTFEKKEANEDGVREKTLVESDRCLIERKQQTAYFTMNAERPEATRFVHVTQPDLHVRGRRVRMNYGDYSQLVHYMTAEEDVLITENPKKYATAGKADFDSRKDIIVLTELPQVYQDGDTVTGDVILMHRDTDIVDVDHSNAYSQGNSP